MWAINANLTEIDQPERIEVLLAESVLFRRARRQPQLGRVFVPEDNAPGISEVAVISDALWRRRFGASPAALGRKLRIDNDWYTIVGVLPPGFRHPGRSVLTDVDVWAPANFSASPFPNPLRAQQKFHHRGGRPAEARGLDRPGARAAGRLRPAITRGVPGDISGPRSGGRRG